MLVYMVHEKHGTHICYSPPEVEDCLANGWKFRDEPKEEPKETTLHLPKKRGRPAKAK